MKTISGNIVFVVIFFSLVNISFSKKHIRISNRRGNGKSVNIWCKSQDDDIGNHTLADGQDLGWGFNPDLFRVTQFYCDVQWNKSVQFHFDAYFYKRDWRRCYSMCHWLIKDESLLGYDQTLQVWQIFFWVIK
ncbi:hypothetical protein GIB67_014129 [Kingdonia uniflora]|uniref:S-protein homolog n=1 Tax=Kingdonia uniflora TaxID=39325 RepID=A0A7J7N478_9MAGN|nr:hypothetical protein GIB67_014129 [Kingdonia uniflora]